MKKTHSLITIVLIVICLAVVSFPQGAVQGAGKPVSRWQAEATPTPKAGDSAPLPILEEGSSPDPQNLVSFSTLGLGEKFMVGPYDSFRVRFSLPATWKLEEGAELKLVITTFVIREGEGSTPLYTSGAIAGSLDITFNGQLIASLVLESGQNVEYRIPIPVEALTSNRADGRHDLFVFLDAAVDCEEENRRTTAVIEPESAFVFPHTLVSPPIDLTRLPWPLYQNGAFLIDPTVIVVPVQPSADELQAAMTVAAGLGRMSNGKLPVTLALENGFSDDSRGNANLIFVGKAAALAYLQAVNLPVPVSEAGFSMPGVQADDGVVQIALSPWNPARVVLVISGGSNAGVIKAAQAFSSGVFQTGQTPDLAIVSEVRPEVLPASVPVDQTFADLGYPIQTVVGIGSADIYYTFIVPPGQSLVGEAYVELVHSHSELLDATQSGVVVSVNGQPVGNLQLAEQNVFQVQKRVYIPASALVAGENLLSIQAELLALDHCSAFRGSNLWFTVFPESNLHLPLEASQTTYSSLKDLNAYPYPFLSDPSLANLAFLVPPDGAGENALAAWKAAAAIAFDMGDRANGILYQPLVATADKVSDEQLQNYDWILVGLPADLPILADLNDLLPAPFDEGASGWQRNVPQQTGGRVIYRLPEGTVMGYLELLTSPWDAGSSILAVLGTDPEALAWAANALLTPSLRSQLCGDFAVVQVRSCEAGDLANCTQVICRDSGRLAAAASTGAGIGLAKPEQAVSQENSNPSAESAEESESGMQTGTQPEAGQPANQSGWIIPVVIGLALLMVVILVIAFYTGRRAKAS